MLTKITRIFLLTSVFTILSGCTGNPKTIPLTTTIQSVYYLNPNSFNRPSPIIVVIYQLKNAGVFKHASFFALYQHASTLLGNRLIDKKQIEIKPNQTKNINLHLSTKAHYLGIIATYRNINRANWRSIIKIKPKTKAIDLNIELQSQRLVVTGIKNSNFCLGSKCFFMI